MAVPLVGAALMAGARVAAPVVGRAIASRGASSVATRAGTAAAGRAAARGGGSFAGRAARGAGKTVGRGLMMQGAMSMMSGGGGGGGTAPLSPAQFSGGGNAYNGAKFAMNRGGL